MLEVADALAIVLDHIRVRPSESVALSAALGHVLARDVTADRDSPPFDKSLRDGYAVRSGDAGELRVVEEIPAGVIPSREIGPGQCARIFTGAPIPSGADAVVMQEDVEQLPTGLVRIRERAKPGQWVYRRGTETRAGDVVAWQGMAITAAAVGVLATVGAASVQVVPRPRVCVLVTGDELVDVSEQPAAGQIRNSNGPMLAALARRAGAEAEDLGIVRDRVDDLSATIGRALRTADVVVLAGGVSVGKYDLVPGILQELGVERHFHQVRMKPGKPLLFGTTSTTAVFGLPGNPVSAAVCFALFVRPALRVLAGHQDSGPRMVSLPLASEVSESNDRPTYRPGRLELAEVGWAVRPLPWSGSPDLRSLQLVDALIVLPAGESRLDPGMVVRVVCLAD